MAAGNAWSYENDLGWSICPFFPSSNLNMESSFTLYPNPASDNVTVSISETSSLSIPDQRYGVNLYNSSGSIIGSYTMLGNIFNIPINNLQEGTYTVKVNNGNISNTSQLIIKRK